MITLMLAGIPVALLALAIFGPPLENAVSNALAERAAKRATGRK
jgi:hypothetical protein